MVDVVKVLEVWVLMFLENMFKVIKEVLIQIIVEDLKYVLKFNFQGILVSRVGFDSYLLKLGNFLRVVE